MGSRVAYRHILVCDGCKIEMPETASAMESRAAAYVAGWRFPSRVKANGDLAVDTSDVCPDCLSSWTAQPAVRGKRHA